MFAVLLNYELGNLVLNSAIWYTKHLFITCVHHMHLSQLLSKYVLSYTVTKYSCTLFN